MSRWEKVELRDLLIPQPKSKVKAGEGASEGIYKFFTSSKVQTKWIDSAGYHSPSLIFGTGGNASVHFCKEKFSTSTDCLVFTGSEIELKTIFLYLDGNMHLLEEGFKGCGLKHISKDYILQIKIPLPPLPTQQKIAKILDKASTLINDRKQQLERLDLLVKARFVEMFGDPVSNPIGWEVKQLSEIIIHANNGMARRGNDLDGNIVLRLVELQDGYIDYRNPNRICLSEAEQVRYLLEQGDFLFARVNGNPNYVGRCAVFIDIGEPVYHNDHIIRVRFDEKALNGAFASELLNSNYGKREMKDKIKTSAGQYTVSQDGINKLKIPLPLLTLQTQFADFVRKIEKSKLEMQQGLEKLELQYNALVQKYFKQ